MGNSNSDIVKAVTDVNKEWIKLYNEKEEKHQKRIDQLISTSCSLMKDSCKQREAQQDVIKVFKEITTILGKTMTESQVKNKITEVYKGSQIEKFQN